MSSTLRKLLAEDRGRISIPANAGLMVAFTALLFSLPGVPLVPYILLLAISLTSALVFLSMLFDDEIQLSGIRFGISGALIMTCVTLGFASVYHAESRFDRSAFNPPLTHTRAVYFAIGNMSTAGSNDGLPQSESARASVATQQVIDVLVFALLIGGVLRRLDHVRT
jgi:hypothetical protein